MSNSILEESRQSFGGKAAGLLELQSAGFRVPEFLISPDDLSEAVHSLGTPLAVRSSATAEDGQSVSFAGQFDSYLNLHSLTEVQIAVERCRASVSKPSVLEYCRAKGVNPASLKMEVIVQRMIQPDLAGVAFTVNPATGVEEVVIEACLGIAEDLLAGRQSSLPADHPLLEKYTGIITSHCRRIQRHFGAPQDIEFAIKDGVFHVLQSRPITQIGFRSDIGEWTNADFRDGGVSSGVCSPLMWSLYQMIWDSSLNQFLRQIKLSKEDAQGSHFFFGRPYWNLGYVKQCVAKLPGFVEREFDRDLSVEAQYEGDGICTPVTMMGVLRVIPTLLAVGKFFKAQSAFDREFLAGGFDALRKKYEGDSADTDRFRKLIQVAYVTTETQYFRTIFACSLAKLDFMNSFPAADDLSLVAALPKISHMAPIARLHEMVATGDRDVAGVTRVFRHHYLRGLDVCEPRWDEDTEFVRELLAQLPESAAVDPRPAYEAARQNAMSGLSARQRKKFNRKLDRLRSFLWLREEMRDCSSQVYYLIRRQALRIAEQRGIGDDIFFMTFQEIFDDDRSHIEHHREVFESYRNFHAPNEIGSRFPYCQQVAEGALVGIGASPGTITGTARVARTVQEAMAVEKDAILICPFTEPGWTPVLDRVAGVVTETGGLLSHAAVICREFGIPAVLGVSQATTRIPDGCTVVVNGNEGHVERLDSFGPNTPEPCSPG